VSEFQVVTPYPIMYAQIVETKYGPTVILKIHDFPAEIINVFLPRRYGMILAIEDMNTIDERVSRAY
jgi:hypothetical protein